MEEAPFLVVVQRIIGGVEIEEDLLRRCVVRAQEQIDEPPLDGRRIGADPGISGRLRLAQFQPVQRRLAGQRRTARAARLKLPANTAITGS